MSGTKLRVGLLISAGGWKGSYNLVGKTHWKGPLENWSGPLVDFVRKAAELGNFTIEIVEVVPPMITNKSKELFRYQSPYFECIYMASLGLVDLCVTQYPIDQFYSSFSDWIILGRVEILFVEKSEPKKSQWGMFRENIYTVFQPFEPSVWIFTNLIVIPMFGFLMVYHERGAKGSVHPISETVIELSDAHDEHNIIERNIPIQRDLVKGYYVSMLAAQTGAWGQRVTTTGGRIHLIGIALFVLIFNSVYTANLAAVLYRERSRAPITTLKQALAAGNVICVDRQILFEVAGVYDFNPFSVAIAKDPFDNLPGFLPGTNRSKLYRTFDFIDAAKADEAKKRGDKVIHYCHTALIPKSYLSVEQSLSNHCNLVVLSKAHDISFGMPMFEEKTASFLPILGLLRTTSYFDSLLVGKEPQSKCKTTAIPSKGELSFNASFSIIQLAGIWFGTGFLVLAGLLATCIHQSAIRRHRKRFFQPLIKQDQHGEEIHTLKRYDSWIHERAIVDNQGRKIIEKPFEMSRNSDGVKRQLMGTLLAAKAVMRDVLETSRRSHDSSQDSIDGGSCHSSNSKHKAKVRQTNASSHTRSVGSGSVYSDESTAEFLKSVAASIKGKRSSSPCHPTTEKRQSRKDSSECQGGLLSDQEPDSVRSSTVDEEAPFSSAEYKKKKKTSKPKKNVDNVESDRKKERNVCRESNKRKKSKKVEASEIFDVESQVMKPAEKSSISAPVDTRTVLSTTTLGDTKAPKQKRSKSKTKSKSLEGKEFLQVNEIITEKPKSKRKSKGKESTDSKDKATTSISTSESEVPKKRSSSKVKRTKSPKANDDSSCELNDRPSREKKRSKSKVRKARSSSNKKPSSRTTGNKDNEVPVTL